MVHSVLKAAMCCALFTSAFEHSAAAQTAEDFYKGKPAMRLVIGSTAGGGYDYYGRLTARYMSKHLPGSPTIVVQNMPGAGGIRAANYIYNVAPRDGTVFGTTNRGIPTAAIFYGKDSKSEFDATKFGWLGSILKEVGVGLVNKPSPAKTIAELTKTSVSCGVTGFESDPAMYARLFNLLVNTKFKIVGGYSGLTESMTALERNEVNCIFLSGWSGPNTARARDLHSRGEVTYFVQMVRQRLPEFGNIPTVFDLVKDPDDRQVINILLARLELGRPFIMPPDIPADRLKVMRQAFKDAARDPDLIAEAMKAGDTIDPVLGEEAQKIIEDVYATPDRIRKRLNEIVKF